MTHSLGVSLSREIANAYPERSRSWNPGPYTIKVDDHEPDDMPLAFCTISVSISDGNSTNFVLTMTNAPCDQEVIDLVDALDGECEEEKFGHAIKIDMTIRDAPKIRRLAKVINKTIGRGKHYLDSKWKWKAPRTARSLEAFAKVLANAYRHARGLESIE